jgi:TRAP-type C4-dicarboxylate transport system substrate-binding protein
MPTALSCDTFAVRNLTCFMIGALTVMPNLQRLLWPVLATLALTLSGCSDNPGSKTENGNETAPPEYPVTWRFALEEIEGSVQHAYAEAFRKNIEQVSDGKIVVDVFPYGSLGTSTQLTELTRNGSVDLAFASPGHLADQVPETGLFNLHYLLPDDAERTRQLLRGPELLEELQPSYESAGLQLLGLVSEGWMAWTANKPLQAPDDFQDLRIRTMTSEMAAEAFRNYGAAPVQTPYAQVYSDLQLHKIDGQANPVFAIEEMGFHEVQSTMTLPRASRFISSVIANPEWFADLTPQEKEWLTTAIRNLSEQAWEIEKELNQERLELMVERGDLEVVRLTEAQRDAFREISQTGRDTYLEATGNKGKALLKLVLTGREPNNGEQ